VRVGPGVYRDSVKDSTSRLDAINELAFTVCLKALDLHAHAIARRDAHSFHVGQSFMSVQLRLSPAERIQIWTINYENAYHAEGHPKKDLTTFLFYFCRVAANVNHAPSFVADRLLFVLKDKRKSNAALKALHRKKQSVAAEYFEKLWIERVLSTAKKKGNPGAHNNPEIPLYHR